MLKRQNKSEKKVRDYIDKIKEFLREYPAVKVFGGVGVIIIFILIIASTIFSVEVENIWNRLVHPGTESQGSSNSSDDGIVAVQPSEILFDDSSELYEQWIEKGDNLKASL